MVHSHVNYVVADTKQWEQSAGYFMDNHKQVAAFVKNAGLGFAYIHNGQPHDYQPDFIIRLKTDGPHHLILETKGYDNLAAVKAQAANRWVDAVNAEGSYGHCQYAVAVRPQEVTARIEGAMARAEDGHEQSELCEVGINDFVK